MKTLILIIAFATVANAENKKATSMKVVSAISTMLCPTRIADMQFPRNAEKLPRTSLFD